MTEPRLRVMIVDDEPDLLLLTRTLLEKDYDVIEAGGGIEALELLNAGEKVDLMLLDIKMPDMDGFAVLEQLEAMKVLDQMKVVAFSAHAEPSVATHALSSGVIGMIHKPFTRAELFTALDKAIGRRG